MISPLWRRFQLLLSAIVFVPNLLGAEALTNSRPNIVVILTDDQGYGDLSCHGNPVLKTPNLDRLHREGARFADFTVSPTCSPTRSALLTGRHEFKNGVTHTIAERERLRLDAITLAEVLKSAGYTTGIFGKWHLGDEDAYQPNKRGFDEVFIHGAGGIGQSYAGSCGDAPGNTYFNPAIWHNDKFVKTNGYCTDLFFGEATRWIDQVKEKPSQPFLAWIGTNAPHAPLQVRPEDEARYKGKVSADEAKFYGMIANIDDRVGDLLTYLEKTGLERTTLVIFMNDNGGTVGVQRFNAGMRGAKGTVWRGGTRGAAFWRWKGRIEPHTIEATAAHIDLFPTLAAIAGAKTDSKIGAQVEGRTLIEPLEKVAKGSFVWPERTFVSHFGRWPKGHAAAGKYATCCLRQGSWTLVQPTTSGQPNWQLYDLSTDPGQQKNLAAQMPEKVKVMAKAYDQWWESVVPNLVNEDAVGPKENPFKERYWRQFGKP